MGNPLTFKTFEDLTLLNKVYTIGTASIGLLLILVGIFLALTAQSSFRTPQGEEKSNTSSGKIIGGIVSFFIGCGFVYWGYYIFTNPKSLKTCNANFWVENKDYKFDLPSGIKENSPDFINLSLCNAQTKAQYDSDCNAFMLKSNVGNTFDVYLLKTNKDFEVKCSSSSKFTLYTVKTGDRKSTGTANVTTCTTSPCSPAGWTRVNGVCVSPSGGSGGSDSGSGGGDDTSGINMTITNITLTGSTISWTNKGTGNPTFEWKQNTSSTWTTTTLTPSSTTTYTLTGLTNSTSYDVRVSYGTVSQTKTFQTLQPTQLNLSVQGKTDTSISIIWSPQSGTQTLKWLQGTSGSFTSTQTFTAGENTYTITGLTRNTQYTIQLTAGGVNQVFTTTTNGLFDITVDQGPVYTRIWFNRQHSSTCCHGAPTPTSTCCELVTLIDETAGTTLNNKSISHPTNSFDFVGVDGHTYRIRVEKPNTNPLEYSEVTHTVIKHSVCALPSATACDGSGCENPETLSWVTAGVPASFFTNLVNKYFTVRDPSAPSDTDKNHDYAIFPFGTKFYIISTNSDIKTRNFLLDIQDNIPADAYYMFNNIAKSIYELQPIGTYTNGTIMLKQVQANNTNIVFPRYYKYTSGTNELNAYGDEAGTNRLNSKYDLNISIYYSNYTPQGTFSKDTGTIVNGTHIIISFNFGPLYNTYTDIQPCGAQDFLRGRRKVINVGRVIMNVTNSGVTDDEYFYTMSAKFIFISKSLSMVTQHYYSTRTDYSQIHATDPMLTMIIEGPNTLRGWNQTDEFSIIATLFPEYTNNIRNQVFTR